MMTTTHDSAALRADILALLETRLKLQPPTGQDDVSFFLPGWNLDEYQFVYIVIVAEARFGVRFPPTDYDQDAFYTLQGFAQAVECLLDT